MSYYARTTYTANGSTPTFSFSFPYISTSHIKAYVNGTEDASITFPTASSITLSSTPANGATVLIKRITNPTARLVDFQDGSVLSASDLDQSANQNFYMAQETDDEVQSKLGTNANNVYDASATGSNLKISNVADPTSAQDVATKNYLENTWLSTTDKANITTLSAQASKIALLGTSDAIADMNTLGTADVVADMNTLGTSDVVADMNTLATSANVTAMGLLGNATTVSNMGLLGTSDAIADMNLLGTSAVLTDLDLLATSANVTAMGLLGTSANVTAMGLLGTADVIADMNTLATSDIVSDLNTLATTGIVDDLNILATSANVTNMATLSASGVVGDIETVADNITNVSNFANRYRISTNNPSTSLDAGDLAYVTSDNALKFYNGSSWSAISTDTDVKTNVSANDTTAGYLNGKLVAGEAVTLTENNDGGNETLTISATDPTPLAIALG